MSPSKTFSLRLMSLVLPLIWNSKLLLSMEIYLTFFALINFNSHVISVFTRDRGVDGENGAFWKFQRFCGHGQSCFDSGSYMINNLICCLLLFYISFMHFYALRKRCFSIKLSRLLWKCILHSFSKQLYNYHWTFCILIWNINLKNSPAFHLLFLAYAF